MITGIIVLVPETEVYQRLEVLNRLRRFLGERFPDVEPIFQAPGHFRSLGELAGLILSGIDTPCVAAIGDALECQDLELRIMDALKQFNPETSGRLH
jgi:hypothetical protein